MPHTAAEVIRAPVARIAQVRRGAVARIAQVRREPVARNAKAALYSFAAVRPEVADRIRQAEDTDALLVAAAAAEVERLDRSSFLLVKKLRVW